MVLVGIYESDEDVAENSLHELAALAETAAHGIGWRLATQDGSRSATYLGSGKARELGRLLRLTALTQ